MSDTLYRLTNIPFKFEWNGEEFEVKKANLEKVAQYQERIRQYIAENTSGADSKATAYALYLILKDVKPNITEEEILKETPGGIDTLELLHVLGFLKPVKESATTT